MSPIGAGVRLESEQAICPSVVPVQLVDTWIEKRAVKKLFGIPRECTHEDIESVKQSFLTGALVARAAGFAGAQLHNAHGFLLSQASLTYL